MKISIVIPVYNAQNTLPKALGSIACQEIEEIEICAVNDCSTDDSSKILSSFKEKFEQKPGNFMKIISHNERRGVAAARNTALEAFTGDYVTFLDADDQFKSDAISSMAQAIQSFSPDIVGWDWELSSPSGKRTLEQARCLDVEDALKSMLSGTLRWNLWLFLIKRELFQDFRFVPGLNIGEDLFALISCLTKSESFVQIHKPLYVYSQTGSSISKVMTQDNLIQSMKNVQLAQNVLDASAFSYLSDPYFDFLKLAIKQPLLVSVDKNDYIRWSNCYPEASRSIFRNTRQAFRTKLLQFLASKKMWFAVWLYNKLVYGLIYKFLLCVI